MSLAVGSRSVRYVCRSCRKSIAKINQQRLNSTRSDSPEIFDVVTVGGGPVGLALLVALKSSPTTSSLKCALIETQDLSKAKSWELPSDEYSNRASSLTPTNVSFLEQIGAWRHLNHDRIQPYDEMQVWDAGNDSCIQFDWKAEAVKYNAPLRTIATMTENANLTKGLLERIAELGAEDSLLTNTSVSSIKTGQDDVESVNLSTWPVLSLTSTSSSPTSNPPSQIAARLLVGADGLNSPVRTFAGINSRGWDYDRHGVVATLKVDSSGQQPEKFSAGILDDFLSDDESPLNRKTAYQRFLPSLGGPIALLPLPDDHASLVWSTTPQIASYLKSLPPSSFIATVNAALSLRQVDIEYLLKLHVPQTSGSESTEHADELVWRLQHTPQPPLPASRQPPQIASVQPGTVASFPLRLRQATAYTAPHIALAGDAAHTVHPLAGQGLNLGLGDVAALAETIAYAVEHGMDMGDSMTLENYGSDRYGKALMMAGGVDALNWIYQLGSNKGIFGDGVVGSAVSQLRGFGMSAVNEIPFVKEFIMRRAD